MQVPAAIPVIVVPLTVQTAGVVELKMTPSPEVAVALAVVVPLTDRVVGLKVIVPIVWLVLSTLMFWVTCEAAL